MTTSVSALIVTRNSADRLARVLASIRPSVDEIITVLDPRADEATVEIARTLSDRVEPAIPTQDFREIYQPMFDLCRGDWILRVDDDEVLTPEWTRERLLDVLAVPEITNIYIPRPWLVPPGDRYICDLPLYPNFALRLFRNDRSLMGVRETVHAQIPIAGPSAFLSDMQMAHLNFLIYSREEREAKVNSYRPLTSGEPGSAGETYYLYEDYDYQTAPFPRPEPKPLFSAQPVAWPYCIDTRIVDMQPHIRAQRAYMVMVEIRNRSNRRMENPPSAFPHRNPRFSFGIHWYGSDGKTSGASIAGFVSDPLWLPLDPGQTRRTLVRTQAPAVSGRYWVRGDLFEAGTGWMALAPGAGFAEFSDVTVTA
jgi:hypothetical protein